MGKIEHFIGCRGTSTGGALLPQTPYKRYLKVGFTLQGPGSAKPNLLHNRTVVRAEPLSLHGPLYCMDGTLVSRHRENA